MALVRVVKGLVLALGLSVIGVGGYNYQQYHNVTEQNDYSRTLKKIDGLTSRTELTIFSGVGRGEGVLLARYTLSGKVQTGYHDKDKDGKVDLISFYGDDSSQTGIRSGFLKRHTTVKDSDEFFKEADEQYAKDLSRFGIDIQKERAKSLESMMPILIAVKPEVQQKDVQDWFEDFSGSIYDSTYKIETKDMTVHKGYVPKTACTGLHWIEWREITEKLKQYPGVIVAVPDVPLFEIPQIPSSP